MTIAEYLDHDERCRARCPVCDSADGLQLSSGTRRTPPDTGFAFCHACRWRGDGIDYLKATGLSHRGAVEALGVGLRAVKAGDAALLELARRKQERILRERAAGSEWEIRAMCMDLVLVREALTPQERLLWRLSGALPGRLYAHRDARLREAVRRIERQEVH